ncbi:MAG: pyridoxal phosphate-dependent aminotransferase family protein [Bacteroidales bacterium]|jgi:7-keto-8-aminopelargonate synthetase-like enzyme|nr:pyridoxal phosphate-dependent aminotransferase family protein [Bacteroidales bacterium]
MIILSSEVGNYIISNGRRYSYFAGNNYLGLAGDARIKAAVISAVEKYGVNFSASRHTTGTADIHLELESALASFKGKEDAVIFASGYLGNSILLEVLRGSYSKVFIDQSAHASIISAIPADVASVIFYDHCNADHLDHLLDQNRDSAPLVITDGLFPLTGEIAPLDRIFPVVSKHHGILVVDDAHATGIIGDTGKGTPEHFGLGREEGIYQTETMSKALGGYGGFISGSRTLTALIRERSATYQASTALPPPIVAAGIASLRILGDNPGLRLKLLESAWHLREEIAGMGYSTSNDRTPIIPLIFDAPEKARGLSLYLEENGVIAPFMNYPVRKEMHQIRITVSVSHTGQQVSQLLDLLNKWKKKNENS